MTDRDAQLDAYFRALSDVDVHRASDVVVSLLDAGSSAGSITREVLAPAQVRVGELWERGTWSIADEHAATAVTEVALSALDAAARRPGTGRERHVVVACAEGEWHALPARMAATVAACSDLRLTVLGPSVPADHLGRRLAAGDVDLLALSCTLPANLLGAAHCVQAAHRAGVPVLAGGRAFGRTPQRARAIGADAWASDPSALARTLPLLAHRATVVPAEVALLDAVDDATLALACDRLLDLVPDLQASPQAHREDLRWMARYTGAAVLTGDETVLDECLSWLCGLPDGRLPASWVATAAQVLAETVEPFSERGAQVLRGAADRLQGALA